MHMEKNIFIQKLIAQTKIVQGHFEESKIIWHNASVGVIRENIIKEVIRPFLPDCYGISSGLCFDDKGGESKQLDIIIYDRMFSYKIPFSEDFMIFPCESVYGNVEIKTDLNKDTLEASIENIRSFKSLSKNNDNNLNPWNYFGMVFTYKSIDSNAIIDYLCSSTYDSILLPDVLVLFEKKEIIFKFSYDKGTNIHLNGNCDGYCSLVCEDETLMFFIISILVLLESKKNDKYKIGKLFKLLIGENIKNIKFFSSPSQQNS